MGKRSLFLKYFSICSSIIFISISLLGIIFTVFATQYFREDKYNLLSSQLQQAIVLTKADMRYSTDENILYVSSNLSEYYEVIGRSIDAHIYFADMNGNVIVSSPLDENEVITHVPVDIMQLLTPSDVYAETGSMGSMLDTVCHTVGKPITDTNNHVIGAVFASTSTNDLDAFSTGILQIFIVTAMTIMLLSFIIIYFMTNTMVRPLQVMATATRSFAKGDFSIRVPVSGDDEIATLSSSFNAMASALATLEQTRRAFTANVSHELKTPMTTIGGFIDGILDGTIPPEKHSYYLRIVSGEVQRLSRLVRSMLDISRIEAGEMEIRPCTVDITDILTRTSLLLEKPITDKNLDIIGLDAGRLFVEADADLIHQVVYNLVDNAVKFVNDGGYIEYKCTEEGGRTFISIRNSGDGLNDEEIDRVFERFYKTDRSRGLDKNGVGLGLYIVRTIINLHGGDIFIRSQPGEYTEFVFSLPTSTQKKGIFRNGV